MHELNLKSEKEIHTWKPDLTERGENLQSLLSPKHKPISNQLLVVYTQDKMMK